MSWAEDVLDELCFAPAPLAVWHGPDLSPQSSTVCRLPAAEGSREFQFALPYFVRNLGRTQLAGHWAGFCNLLRQHGIPIFAEVASFQDVPIAAIPARWGRRWLNTPIDPLELETADAFELSGCEASQTEWGWSSECTVETLPGLVSAVRAASGHDTPIGMSLPLNAHTSDVQNALAAGVDFLTLCSRQPRLSADELHGLVRCRQVIERSSQRPTPLLVCAPLSHQDHLHKLLALGASAVCVDHVLQKVLAQHATSDNDSSGSGMLSGLLPTSLTRANPVEAMAQALETLRTALKQRLRTCGALQLNELNRQALRSCTSRAHQLTGTPLLSCYSAS